MWPRLRAEIRQKRAEQNSNKEEHGQGKFLVAYPENNLMAIYQVTEKFVQKKINIV